MKIVNQVTCTIIEVEGAPTLQDVLDRMDIPGVTIKVEEYLRVFGADNKTVLALKIVLEVLKSEYPDL